MIPQSAPAFPRISGLLERFDIPWLRLVAMATPLGAAVVVYRFNVLIEPMIAAALVVGLLVLVVRHPGRAVVALVVMVPMQPTLFSLMYRFGVPAALLRPLGAWRDAVVVGLLVAGIQAARRRGTSLDFIDKIAIAFVVLVFAYFLFPSLFVGTRFYYGGPILLLTTRSLALRLFVTPVLLFLAVRHLRLDKSVRDNVVVAVIAVGVLASAATIYEFTLTDSFYSFVFNTLELPRYLNDVLDIPPYRTGLGNRVVVAGREFARPGGLAYDPLHNGFYLLLPLAAGLQLLKRRRLHVTFVALGLSGLALLMSYVRSATVGAFGLALVALRSAGRRTLQFSVGLVAALGIIAVVALSTGFVGRTSDTASDASHRESFDRGVKVLQLFPLGLGLGSTPGVASAPSGNLTAENAYLQVGNEVGILGMVLFTGFVASVLSRLVRASRRVPDELIVGFAASAGVALAIAALFLHVWVASIAVLTFWPVAGMAMSVIDADPEARPQKASRGSRPTRLISSASARP